MLLSLHTTTLCSDWNLHFIFLPLFQMQIIHDTSSAQRKVVGLTFVPYRCLRVGQWQRLSTSGCGSVSFRETQGWRAWGGSRGVASGCSIHSFSSSKCNPDSNIRLSSSLKYNKVNDLCAPICCCVSTESAQYSPVRVKRSGLPSCLPLQLLMLFTSSKVSLFYRLLSLSQPRQPLFATIKCYKARDIAYICIYFLLGKKMDNDTCVCSEGLSFLVFSSFSNSLTCAKQWLWN